MVDGIRVYFEGDKKLKPGFHAFFGNHVRSGLKFDLIHGNGGSETIKDFMNAVETHPDAFNILLIDSDKPDNGKLIPSLKSRSEWNSQIASDVSDDQIHFMVQVMEAWFLADRNALKAFYGGAFAENQLPIRPNGGASIQERRDDGATKRHSRNTEDGVPQNQTRPRTTWPN